MEKKINKRGKTLIGISLVLLILIISFITLVEGSNTAAISPGTMAEDTTVGTVAWGLGAPNNAKVSDDQWAITSILGYSGNLRENSIKIVKDGSIQGNEKSTGATLPTTDTYISYGGETDKWGLEWTADDINDATFGVVFSAIKADTSYYLKATNFGFSISGTIDGIKVEIEEDQSGTLRNAWVDHIRITVYYTEGDLDSIEPYECSTFEKTIFFLIPGFILIVLIVAIVNYLITSNLLTFYYKIILSIFVLILVLVFLPPIVEILNGIC